MLNSVFKHMSIGEKKVVDTIKCIAVKNGYDPNMIDTLLNNKFKKATIIRIYQHR